MHEFLKTKPALAYAWFWVWMAFVSIGTISVYDEITWWAGLVILDALDLSGLTKEPPAPWLQKSLLYAGGVLFWWRAVKVVVLHGAPLSLGLNIYPGRQDGGKTGRLSTQVHIGDHNVYVDDYSGKFYYGAVFRAHPNSDKLMRSRLELLVLFIPLLDLTLIVQESRVYIRKWNHESRVKIYRLASASYMDNSRNQARKNSRSL